MHNSMLAFVESLYRGEPVNYYKATGGGAPSEAVVVAASDANEIITILAIRVAVSGATTITIESKGESDSVTLFKGECSTSHGIDWVVPDRRTRKGDSIVLTSSADESISVTASIGRRQDVDS